ncbi:hypothetical protein DPMN_055530 [Dreissena polymorpha]|uniref:Uncharacterized protein n=1 Tax=Dreissena polymorpha TaxID=45954 RepID=A0A9D4CQ51_DREPO|nr:hypothetical protein DPMN_055530 [Dreissena polymorpha]
MLTPRIMKLHRYIDHDWQMTPIDFQVTSYVALTRTLSKILTFGANKERNCYAKIGDRQLTIEQSPLCRPHSQ